MHDQAVVGAVEDLLERLPNHPLTTEARGAADRHHDMPRHHALHLSGSITGPAAVLGHQSGRRALRARPDRHDFFVSARVKGAGLDMTINTGLGGSYLNLQTYRINFKSHTGALRARWGETLGESKPGFEFDSAGAVPPVAYGVAGSSGGGIISVKVGDVIRTGRNVTGSRPSASASGAGAMFYDTTLSKPIWSDGTVWRDAQARLSSRPTIQALTAGLTSRATKQDSSPHGTSRALGATPSRSPRRAGSPCRGRSRRAGAR